MLMEVGAPEFSSHAIETTVEGDVKNFSVYRIGVDLTIPDAGYSYSEKYYLRPIAHKTAIRPQVDRRR